MSSGEGYSTIIYLVTHDIEVGKLTNRILTMRNGRIVSTLDTVSDNVGQH